MRVTTVTDDEQTYNANQVKEVLLAALEKEGLLTKPAQEICENYAVVLYRKGFLGRIIDKFFNVPDNHLRIYMVKIIQ